MASGSCDTNTTDAGNAGCGCGCCARTGEMTQTRRAVRIRVDKWQRTYDFGRESQPWICGDDPPHLRSRTVLRTHLPVLRFLQGFGGSLTDRAVLRSDRAGVKGNLGGTRAVVSQFLG